MNTEIKRRTDVIGVFPKPATLLRLVGILLVLNEAHDEWQVSDRPNLFGGSRAQIGAIHPHASKEGRSPTSSPQDLNHHHREADHDGRELHHAVGRDLFVGQPLSRTIDPWVGVALPLTGSRLSQVVGRGKAK